jgi:hypothetical protein
MKSGSSRKYMGRGVFRFLSAGIFLLLAAGATLSQDTSGEKLRTTLSAMQGNWEQNATDKKSWGMDCSGKIKITRTLSLDEIDEDKRSITGTYTRDSNGSLDTSSTVMRALRSVSFVADRQTSPPPPSLASEPA